MALDNQFGKGIGVTAGFDLGAQKPLDARVAVNTIAERDAHVENNRAYEGMLVYVAEANMTYQLVKGAEEGQLIWKEFGFNQNDFDESFEGAIEEVDNRLKAVEEDLAQGGEIEARIAQNESDIDGLQGLVGKPVEGEEPATGLHLALDQAKEELEQAILDEKGRAEGVEAAIRQELADEAGEIRGEMEDLGEAIRGEMAEQHQVMDKALVDEAAAIRGEMATEAARVDKKIADDIAAESVLRVAEEQRIEKAAQDAMAQEVIYRNAAIKAEEDRAVAKEGELQEAIEKEVADREAAVKGENERAVAKEGELDTAIKQEVADREAAVKGENERAVAAEELLAGRLDVIEGEGEGSIKKAVADLAGRHDEEMDAVEGRVAALEGLHEGENSVENQIANAKQEALDAVEDEKDRAEEQERLIREELAAEKLALQKEIDDDVKVVADELAKQKDANQEGTLAKQIADEVARADAEEKRIVGLVETEKGRAEGIEAGLQTAIEKEVEDREAAIEGLANRHDQEMDAAEARIKVNEDKLAVIEGEGEGSIKKALEDAKKHADDAITALVDSAPDAMNTLNELAEAIKGNKDIYDGYVDQHAQAMANLKTELQAEIDADVKVEADRAVAKEAELLAAINQEKADREADVNAEEQRALAAEQAIRDDMAEELGAWTVEGAEGSGLRKEVEDQINELAEHVAAQDNVIRGEFAAAIGEYADLDNLEEQPGSGLRAEIQQYVQMLEEGIGQINEELNQAIVDEKERAEGQEAAIRQELANEKAALQKEIDDDVKVEADRALAAEGLLAGRLDVIEGEGEGSIKKAVADEQARAEGQEAAIRGELADAIADEVEARNAAIAAESTLRVAEEQRIEKAAQDAMAQEVIDRNAAINVEKLRAEGQEAAIRGEFAAADEVLHGIIKGEMAAVIQSLAVGIVDGKLRVALGGIEGDDVLVIREQEVPFVTDAEIDEIIAGLDTPAAE